MAGTTSDIHTVLRRHRAQLLAVKGVVGVGVGQVKGEKVVQVMVSKRLPEHDRKIPSVLENYRVVIVETGPFRARKQGE